MWGAACSQNPVNHARDSAKLGAVTVGKTVGKRQATTTVGHAKSCQPGRAVQRYRFTHEMVLAIPLHLGSTLYIVSSETTATSRPDSERAATRRRHTHTTAHQPMYYMQEVKRSEERKRGVVASFAGTPRVKLQAARATQRRKAD